MSDVVKLSDVTVADSTSGGLGGCFEVVSSTLECLRRTVTEIKVRAEPATTILFLRRHHSHHVGAGGFDQS